MTPARHPSRPHRRPYLSPHLDQSRAPVRQQSPCRPKRPRRPGASRSATSTPTARSSQYGSRTSSDDLLGVGPQAEGVSGRIVVNPNVALRLMLGQDRADGYGMGTGIFEVFDLDVEMHHHLLVIGVGRPRRADIGVLKLEGEADTTVGIAQRDPLRFVGPDLPSEQSLIKAFQLPRVR